LLAQQLLGQSQSRPFLALHLLELHSVDRLYHRRRRRRRRPRRHRPVAGAAAVGVHQAGLVGLRVVAAAAVGEQAAGAHLVAEEEEAPPLPQQKL
jgi:hypothetical protein